MRKLLIIILFLQFFAVYSASPSFDCQKASTIIEKTICTDSKLAMLDSQIAEKVKQVIHASSGNAAAFLQQQKSWLKLRNQTCRSQCGKKTLEVMQERSDELTLVLNWFRAPLWVDFTNVWNNQSVQFFGNDQKKYLITLDKISNSPSPDQEGYKFFAAPILAGNEYKKMTDKEIEAVEYKKGKPVNNCADLKATIKNKKTYRLMTLSPENDQTFCHDFYTCIFAANDFARTCRLIDLLREIKPVINNAFSFNSHSIPDINLYQDADIGSAIGYIDYSKESETAFEQYVPYTIESIFFDKYADHYNTIKTKISVIARGNFTGNGKEQLLIFYTYSDTGAHPPLVDAYYLLERGLDGTFKMVEII